MKLPIRLPSGEVKSVDLIYERLDNHCFVCFSLGHEEKDCPRNWLSSHSSERNLGPSQQIALERLESERRKADRKMDERESSSAYWVRKDYSCGRDRRSNPPSQVVSRHNNYRNRTSPSASVKSGYRPFLTETADHRRRSNLYDREDLRASLTRSQRSSSHHAAIQRYKA
ncbi:unnamed protein product [Arabis nemorensis]|uniref:CCHC-type domain-containing protein n=1 Tax=Arabis nemorensis TaxID=586526 RepID=A0A565CBJ2_9BRAS|nr:unnamed protein product [Arabis nemorensis]